MNVMNVTNSNGMKSCAPAEASVFTQLTPPYKAYNQSVSFVNKTRRRTLAGRMKMMAAAMFIGIASLLMASCNTSEEDYDKVIHPDKEIVPIHSEILALLGGGIHCVTQQQPVFY